VQADFLHELMSEAPALVRLCVGAVWGGDLLRLTVWGGEFVMLTTLHEKADMSCSTGGAHVQATLQSQEMAHVAWPVASCQVAH
jgi:hypothetical protein